MSDATVTWNPTTTGTPTAYLVAWSQNSIALPAISVPVSAQQDASGYSNDFATSNPTVALNPGDTLAVTVQAVDTKNNLQGPVTPSVPASVQIPTAPVAPGSPTNVVLALS